MSRWWDKRHARPCRLAGRRLLCHRRFQPLQFQLLLFECSNEFSDETGGLFGVGREFVISICLKFRGLVAEGTFNTFAELQLSSGSRALQVWKPLTPQILYLRDKVLQLLNTLREVFDVEGFGPHSL